MNQIKVKINIFKYEICNYNIRICTKKVGLYKNLSRSLHIKIPFRITQDLLSIPGIPSLSYYPWHDFTFTRRSCPLFRTGPLENVIRVAN